jgi:hypothetical protein
MSYLDEIADFLAHAVVAHSIASVENQCGRAIKVPQRSIPVLIVSDRAAGVQVLGI